MTNWVAQCNQLSPTDVFPLLTRMKKGRECLEVF
jgi:hypothetical protein